MCISIHKYRGVYKHICPCVFGDTHIDMSVSVCLQICIYIQRYTCNIYVYITILAT